MSQKNGLASCVELGTGHMSLLCVSYSCVYAQKRGERDASHTHTYLESPSPYM